jgi:hypothetical protein
MNDTDTVNEPDWDSPLHVSVTPAQLIHALFSTANVVHTGWSSCVERSLVVADLAAMDDGTGNYCRLVEQEFTEEDRQDTVWHDWAVEIRIGEILIVGHWQLESSTPPLDWEWASREAESAFEKACVLFGKRIRRGILVEDPPGQAPTPKSKHH